MGKLKSDYIGQTWQKVGHGNLKSQSPLRKSPGVTWGIFFVHAQFMFEPWIFQFHKRVFFHSLHSLGSGHSNDIGYSKQKRKKNNDCGNKLCHPLQHSGGGLIRW